MKSFKKKDSDWKEKIQHVYNYLKKYKYYKGQKYKYEKQKYIYMTFKSRS